MLVSSEEILETRVLLDDVRQKRMLSLGKAWKNELSEADYLGKAF